MLGGVDDRYYQNPLQYVPLTQETYYIISIADIYVANNSMRYSSESRWTTQATIDSGTTLIYVPSSLFRLMQALIRKEICSHPEIPELCSLATRGGLFSIETCFKLPSWQLHYLPTLSFIFDGEGGKLVQLELPPTAYMITVHSKSGNSCVVLGITRDTSDSFIIGDTFMRYYTVVFDREKKRLGFSPVVNCSTEGLPKIEPHSEDGGEYDIESEVSESDSSELINGERPIPLILICGAVALLITLILIILALFTRKRTYQKVPLIKDDEPLIKDDEVPNE